MGVFKQLFPVGHPDVFDGELLQAFRGDDSRC